MHPGLICLIPSGSPFFIYMVGYIQDIWLGLPSHLLMSCVYSPAMGNDIWVGLFHMVVLCPPAGARYLLSALISST